MKTLQIFSFISRLKNFLIIKDNLVLDIELIV